MTMLKMDHYTDPKPDPWPWPNFSPYELASNGDGSVQIDNEAGDKLQSLRTEWGKPLTLNSAYRDPIYNTSINGAKLSKHMLGQAFDISVRSWLKIDKQEFKELAWRHGFRGFGGYDSFIHIDIGRARKWGKSWAWPKVLK